MKTINNIRRENLALLRDECGGVGKLADRLEKSPSQVSQWLNASANSGTGKPRGISDVACRYIEEKFEKPHGWMDAPHADDTVASAANSLSAEDAAELLLLYGRSDQEGREAIMNMARAMAARNESAVAAPIQHNKT